MAVVWPELRPGWKLRKMNTPTPTTITAAKTAAKALTLMLDHGEFLLFFKRYVLLVYIIFGFGST